MKIPELLNLINELVSNEKLTKKERNSLASSIKKQYGITIKDLRYSGREISIRNLRSLIRPLIENYDSVKDLNSINEVLQTMAEDYDTSYITTERDQKSVGKEKEKVYAIILGNPGTTIDGMSSEYISKIIKRKLTEEQGINRDDIMNVLNMQAKNMYLNIEEYQKLINDSVISYLTSNQNGERFSNPKIFGVFQSLASSYKIQGDFDKVKEVYEQALRIKSLENTQEYRELKNNYEKFLDFMEMKRNFEDKRFDSFEDLMKSLTTKFTTDRIFAHGNGNSSSPNPNPNPPTPPHSNYVMPVKKKLEGFKRLVNALKRDNEDYDIVECELGKEAYDGYVIFKIENANVSILENFNEVNARIFVVKNEMIDQVKQLTRNDAIALEGVEGANHIENFDNYCRNLIKKTRKLIRQTQIGIASPSDDEIVFDDDILDIPSDEPETPIQLDNEVADDDNTKVEDETKDTTEKTVTLDNVEMERRKAHENRKELQRLEKTLEEIQKNTNEKIANVLNQSEHSQD